MLKRESEAFYWRISSKIVILVCFSVCVDDFQLFSYFSKPRSPYLTLQGKYLLGRRSFGSTQLQRKKRRIWSRAAASRSAKSERRQKCVTSASGLPVDTDYCDLWLVDWCDCGLSRPPRLSVQHNSRAARRQAETEKQQRIVGESRNSQSAEAGAACARLRASPSFGLARSFIGAGDGARGRRRNKGRTMSALVSRRPENRDERREYHLEDTAECKIS